MRLQRRSITFLITCIVLLIVTSTIFEMEISNHQQRQKEELLEEVSIVQSNIQNLVLSRITNANGFGAYIEVNNGISEKEFLVFAESLFRHELDIVKDIMFVKDTTIQYVYPKKFAKGTVGKNLGEIPEQRGLIMYTKLYRESVFLGPVDLVEGGQGIIIRVPVLVEGRYYGQVGIVFDYEAFLEYSGVNDLSDENVVLMVGSNPTDAKDKIVVEKGEIKNIEDAVHKSININNITWTLYVEPKGGWETISGVSFLILSIASALLLILIYSYKKEMKLYHQITEAKNQLEMIVNIDELTGLHSRRVFMKDLKEMLERGKEGIIALVDIDDFKRINDLHGHQYGDLLLRKAAKEIQPIVEKNKEGKIYRFGGDEFLIIFEKNVTNEEIKKHANKIKESLDIAVFFTNNHALTVSAGIAKFPKDGVTVESLLSKVDIAMYEAKITGKNKLMIYQEDFLKTLDEEIALEQHLREMLEDDGFEMNYQPIVNSNTGEIETFEALIRLKDRSYPPNIFIGAAEKADLIIPLGHWILDEVFGEIHKWIEEGYIVKPVAINLSPNQLFEQNFVAKFFHLFEEYEIPKRLVQVEITENVLLENEKQNVTILSDLRNAGITVSMDDFGTGFSSIKYLTYLPIDKVKIDKSLKDQLLLREGTDVLSGMTTMIHGLNMSVVVEGIEEEIEWEKLKEIGCDQLQGYFFSKPVSAEEMNHILEKKER